MEADAELEAESYAEVEVERAKDNDNGAAPQPLGVVAASPAMAESSSAVGPLAEAPKRAKWRRGCARSMRCRGRASSIEVSEASALRLKLVQKPVIGV